MLLTNDPVKVVTVTLGDKTFRAGQRTAAHLLWTIEQLAKRFPGTRLHVIQPCYNDDVDVSEGTHDFDGVLDVQIIGLDWMAAQRFLRQCGWFAWFRGPPFAPHIHMGSLGCPGPLGVFVDGGLSQFGRKVSSSQIDDYYNHAFGLENQHTPGSDRSWFPLDIDSTIFSYPAFLRAQEDAMPYTDWPQADKDALVRDVAAAVKVPSAKEIAAAVMAAPVNNKGTKAKAVLELLFRKNSD